jgi:hypothetical protein
MYAFDAPLVARFFAIEELRASGWKHVAAVGAPPPRATPEAPAKPDRARGSGPAASRSTRDDAERMWSGATYCPECAARAAARARARATAATAR